MQDELRAIAEYKIVCLCGNRDWNQFLYVGFASNYIAGCKRCGRTYTYVNNQWVNQAGPAPLKE